MKLSAVLFTAMAAMTQGATEQRELAASLAQKWNITEPDFEYDSLTFRLDYKVSDYIYGDDAGTDSGMVQYVVYDQFCADGSDATTPVVTVVASSDTTANPVTNADGIDSVVSDAATVLNAKGVVADNVAGLEMSQTVSVNVTLDAESITDNTFLYTEDTSFGAVTAEIRFCVRFSLHTPNTVPTTVEVNFLETIVTLNVDLSDGFEIGSIAVEPKDRLVRTANQVYQVRAYQCSTGNIELSQAQKDATRNQGSVIRVCVTPDAEAFADGIKMRSIDSFAFVREADTANEVRQVAVANRLAAANLLTTYVNTDCSGSDVCNFETILFASFYTALGQVFGSGVASMQFGARRNLREGANARDLQEDDAAAAAEFELEFGVNPVQEVPSSSSTVSAMLGGMMAVTVAAML